MSESPAPAGAARTDPPLLPQAVMEYLQQHGFDKALQTFQAELQGMQAAKDGGDGAAGEGGGSGGADEHAAREAIFRAPGPVTLEAMVKRNIPQATTMSASASVDTVTPEFIAQAKHVIDQLQSRLESATAAGAGEDEDAAGTKVPGNAAAFIDSSDRSEGYRRYRRWVADGLDLWKPELDLLSFPLFAHTYLDLVEFGFKDAARQFFTDQSDAHRATYPSELSHLSSVNAAHQILLDPFAQRLRYVVRDEADVRHGNGETNTSSQRYVVPVSRNAFALLMQWLSGAGLDEEWEMGLHGVPGRAKEAVRAIVHNRLDLKVAESSAPLDTAQIASSIGLTASLLSNGASVDKLAAANPLKLGPAPMHEKLREEVGRVLREEDEPAEGGNNGVEGGHDADGDVDMGEGRAGSAAPRSPSKKTAKLEPEERDDKDADKDKADLVSPEPTEVLPPLPNFYKVVDVKREIEAIRDKRKAVRLGTSDDDKAGPSSMTLPSVVAFTMFDNNEGITSVEFSPDSSLVAAGSAESSIRLWSLKNEKLKAKSLDPVSGDLVEDEGLAVRKLIGHSGPVYSLSFDPIAGSSAPPHALLSASQDSTIRLWSMDTYSNAVIYRGHGRDPVWDVEWGPMGVYFASASRDRTARLWCSERVTPVRIYTGHLSDVNCIKFHPNSLYLATGSADNSCRLWDVQRGGCVRLFLGHTDAVTTLAVSPDGRTLASAGLDTSIYLWDLGSSRPIKKMTGHTGPVTSLSFSAESSVLVSGALDGTVRCWDTKSAGGAKTTKLGALDDARRGSVNIDMSGGEIGTLPMGPGDVSWESGQTADLLATFRTKRTPIIKAHYTPRNLCMVAGTFVPPSARV
ncbi:Transcription initiation factor TFIID subunit 5 [Cryptotrichosporon argae]